MTCDSKIIIIDHYVVIILPLYWHCTISGNAHLIIVASIGQLATGSCHDNSIMIIVSRLRGSGEINFITDAIIAIFLDYLRVFGVIMRVYMVICRCSSILALPGQD